MCTSCVLHMVIIKEIDMVKPYLQYTVQEIISQKMKTKK